ncbi:MAG: hypothetical protein Ta2D_03040 [Rickettsiales bacterium]|nr:MAG: hypothetical protein Ta2D_03040 [Rickettsiales bacterium]
MKRVVLFLFIVMATANALIIGIDPAREPFAYYDEKHNLIGFDVDFFAEVEKELGEPIEMLHMPFSGLLPALETGKIDMLGTSITVTPEREKKVAFTKQIYKPNLSFVGKKNVKDLTKEKIGVVIGTPNADILKKLNYENIVYFDSADMLYVSLEEGKVDYIFHNNITNKKLY